MAHAPVVGSVQGPAQAPAPGGPRDPRELDREAALRAAVEDLAHYLPDQGPLEVFIHHNTLHGFQHQPFHEAVARASALYGARPYLPDAQYRELLASGRIREENLELAFAEREAAERWADVLLLGGALSSLGLRHLALRYPLEAVSPATLRWLLDEEQLATRLPADAPRALSARLIRDGAAWLRRLLAQGDLATLGAALTGESDPARAEPVLRERLGVKRSLAALERQLDHRPEGMVASATWEACRRLSAGCRRSSAQAETLTHREALRRLAQSSDPDATDVATQVHRLLIRTCSAFLDLGFAQWEMPQRQEGYYRAARRLLAQPGAGPEPFLLDVQRAFAAQATLGRTAAQVVLEILDELGVPAREHETYLSRLLLELPGWAGMTSRLERHPEDRPAGSPPASLLDYVAVLLTLEREAVRGAAAQLVGPDVALRALREHLARQTEAAAPLGEHDGAYRLYRLLCLAGLALPTITRLLPQDAERALAELEAFDAAARGRVFHEAYERNHRQLLLDALAEHRGHITLVPPPARLQIFFCFDEREEAIRRAIESLSPAYQTFGVPGFYGMAMDYRGLEEPHPVPLAPVVVRPEHEVHEEPHPEDAPRHHLRARLRRAWARLYHLAAVGARAPLHGAALTLSLGLLYLVPLSLRVLFPRGTARLQARLLRRALPPPRTQLRADHEPQTPTYKPGKHTGFTTAELTQRVASLLENAGLTRDFAPLVVLFGHGSTTRNNPHASAYNCGACGGRRGGANARLFATAVNRPEIREALRARGLHIPDETRFLAGVHDTSTDELELFDTAALPESHRAPLAELRLTLRAAALRSAHERCRRFTTIPHEQLSPSEALRYVESRAESLAEPRPEYGHATNVVCLVGRRALTRGLFLDRRAFLISYDPTQDPAGTVLERILAAATPVGAGINLEYFFSAVDNERYGCGTKLAHNLAGLLGVMNGTDSDLRTGLPLQTVEIHEPMRMLTLIEATPQTLLAIAARQPEVRELIVNRWIQLVSIDPQTGTLQVYTDSGFVPYEPATGALPTVREWEEWYRGRSEHLGPARLIPPSPTGPSAEPAHA